MARPSSVTVTAEDENPPLMALAELRSTLMGDDDSPDTMARGGEDETAVMPDLARTQAAAALAWSEVTDYPRRRYRPGAYTVAAVIVVASAVLAGAVGFTVWMLRPGPESGPPMVTAGPPVTLPAPPPQTSTVTVSATPTSTAASTPTVAAPPSVWVPTTTAPRWTPSPNTDEQYLSYLRSQGIVIYDGNLAVQSAHKMCGERANGVSPPQIVDEWLPENPQVTLPLMVSFVHAAQLFYCPQYLGGQ